ncbi:MAG: hypothetical protein UU89_C0036G0007 [Parcubacteria group bacterium GW2011_GWC2_42_11]|nr:MAG: hypothetical protein UU89_C0036G0007 [Parcubacteria group bacterium GW2011_GWC2_42_11]
MCTSASTQITMKSSFKIRSCNKSIMRDSVPQDYITINALTMCQRVFTLEQERFLFSYESESFGAQNYPFRNPPQRSSPCSFRSYRSKAFQTKTWIFISLPPLVFIEQICNHHNKLNVIQSNYILCPIDF